MPDKFLEVESLSKKFGNFTAVDRVSFSINKGESFALLGESGCGKTTLLRCLAGLETPHSGSIEVAGKKFYENKNLIPVNERNIGLVFQDYAVFPHKSVDETFHLVSGTRLKKLKSFTKCWSFLNCLTRKVKCRINYPVGSCKEWLLPEPWHPIRL